MMSFLIVVFMVYAFRFFWLYVPAAMNVGLNQFLMIIRPYTSSLYILALWMMCSIPLFVILIGVARVFLLVFPDISPGVSSPVYTVIMTPMRAAFELGIAMSCALGMAYGLRSMMSGKKPKGIFW